MRNAAILAAVLTASCRQLRLQSAKNFVKKDDYFVSKRFYSLRSLWRQDATTTAAKMAALHK